VAAWDSSSTYVVIGIAAVVANPTKTGIIWYKLSGGSLSQLTDPTQPHADNPIVYAADWHPDGEYLAVGHLRGSEHSLSLYKRSGDTLTLQTTPSNQPADNSYGLSWTADGGYLAVTSVADIGLYTFSTGTLTRVQQQTGFSNEMWGCEWDASGVYLGIGVLDPVGTEFAMVQKRSGNTLSTLETFDLGEGWWSFDVSWHASGRYLIAGHIDGTSPPTWWRRDDDTFTLLDEAATGFGADIVQMAFHPENTTPSYVAAGGFGSPFLGIYRAAGLDVEVTEPHYASILVPILTRIGKYGDVQLSVAPLTSIGDVPIRGDMELVVPLYAQIGE
jgi:hypothetical protein